MKLMMCLVCSYFILTGEVLGGNRGGQRKKDLIYKVRNEIVPQTSNKEGADSINATLWIPEKGAWLGAEVSNCSVQSFREHESKISRQLDILRFYHGSGSWTTLTSNEHNYINAGRKVFVSFKPNSKWINAVGAANGGSSSVDAQLTKLAKSVASIKPKKMMICVWHEPQNDVGKAGTTQEYIAMWHNVRAIFDTNGATNVIWSWVVQGYSGQRKLVNVMWPGNQYVDWVAWDMYQGSSSDKLVSEQAEMYNWFSTNSDSIHDYVSKPWAWGEWGIGVNSWTPTAVQQVNTINAINAAVNANQYPRVHYMAYFDNNNAPNATSAILSGAWQAYSSFANSPYMTQYDSVTSVTKSNKLPEKFLLFHNYPNPFNPSTEINYSIAKSGFVTLKVYNILGQEVAELFDGYQKAGLYNIDFDASKLASGVYIYRLRSSGLTQTKKMILMK